MSNPSNDLTREELAAWLRLEMAPGVGNRTARQLLLAFGLPQNVFDASAHTLEQVVTPRQRSGLQSIPPQLPELLETTWRWLQSAPLRHRVLTLGDPAYPPSLLEMEDPPLLLYVRGPEWAWTQPAARQCIAMVGSRNPTTQGSINARQFAAALTQAGMTIVSGLALGVDAAAHEGALSAVLPNAQESDHRHIATIAVVGTGLDRVYPSQHRHLAHQISDNGLLISELPLGTPPISNNFPKRNRIIAGLSSATLVVEAAMQSGSLITARLTNEQGKDVFAIPGLIHSPQARGCHALIKQGAKLVETADDILDEMHAFSARPPLFTPPPPRAPTANAVEEDDILLALQGATLGLDALQVRTGMDISSLQAKLMEHEIEGHIARLPGGLFQRLVRNEA
jgi:DNA processing protein